MRRSQTVLICLLGLSLLAPAVRALADARPNQYDMISDRNVFKLKPLPPPIDPHAVQPDPPIKVTLTGITTILGDALALLEAQPQGKPKIFLTLAEGQRENDISVISIDQKAGTVTIKNQDLTQTLDMGDAAKRAGAGGAMAGNSPVPSNLPMAAPGDNSVRDLRSRSIPTRRDMRVTTSGDNSTAPNSGPNFGGGSSGMTMSGNTGSQTAAQGDTMTPEEQVVQMEVNRELTKNQVIQGQLPPPPPTIMTPKGSLGVDIALP
ncbi:MAG TPA: hypothetical protein VH255_04575 [Verrucomicrobiae bacterium]|nr:hypothetical protein [Verrucomicrobiae bacterium]